MCGRDDPGVSRSRAGYPSEAHPGRLVAVKTVVDPEGRQWRVGRLWFTHRARWRSPLGPRRIWDVADGFDLADLVWDVPGIGVAIALVVSGVVVGVLAVLFVIPALALLVELLIVVLVAVGALVFRVLLRRPWLVVARRRASEERIVRRVVGFRASRRAVDDLAGQLRRGESVVSWVPEQP